MKNILIVEDNSLDRRLISFLLNNAFANQINIFEASDGNKAIQILSGNQIDLVVTDLFMPNIEGIELIRIIRNQFPEIENLLAISGKNPYYLYLAKKMGVQGVFTKPLDKDKFLTTIGKLLNIEAKQFIAI